MKLPEIPPAFLLSIQINSNHMFSASFGSLEDLVNDEVWKAATDNLHEMMKEWIKKEGEKDAQSV